MSDDTDFGFGTTERTEVEGPIKVTDVVGVEVGKAPIPDHLEESKVEKEAEDIWVDIGDTYNKTDPDLGEFEVTVITIYRVEEEDRDAWYEVEIEYQPIVDGDEDKTRTPLVKKQSIRSFAQEALTLDAIDDAGLSPEKRDDDVTTTETV